METPRRIFAQTNQQVNWCNNQEEKYWIPVRTLKPTKKTQCRCLDGKSDDAEEKIDKPLNKSYVRAKTFYVSQIEELQLSAARGETRKLFKQSEGITGYQSEPPEILREPKNTTIYDTTEKLEQWARQFRRLLNFLPPTGENWDSREQTKGFSHKHTKHETTTEVASSFKLLKNNKAPRNDNLQPKRFKYGSDQLIAAPESLLKRYGNGKKRVLEQ